MITRENYEIWFLDYAEGKLNASQKETLFKFLQNNPDLKQELENFESIELPKTEKSNSPFNALKKNQSWLFNKYSEEELVFHVSEGLLNKEELREWNELCQVHPDLLNKVAAENKVKLVPDNTLHFAGKSFLKQTAETFHVDINNYKEMFVVFAEEKNETLGTLINAFVAKHPETRKELELSLAVKLKADPALVYEHKASLKKKQGMVIAIQWRYAMAAAAMLLLAVLFYNPFTTKEEGFAKTDLPKDSVLIKENPAPIQLANTEDKNTSKEENNSVVPQKRRNNSFIKNNPVNNSVVVPDNKEQMANIKKDSVIKQIEKPNELFANTPVKKDTLNKTNKNESFANTTTRKNSQSSEGGISKPMEFVASVINKQYYADQTPVDKMNSSFYAMRNVVGSVSNGNAKIDKKEDEEYKEVKFKVGKFGFSRKTAK